MAKDVFSTFQAAEYCDTSYMSIKRWIMSGKLKAYKTPGGHNRINKRDLINFMMKNNIPITEKVDIDIIRRKILIVDDDIQVREGIANYLRMNGQNYEVVTAEDGFEAGIIVNQFNPDLIILDLLMPKINGFKVCEKIKKNLLTKDIKILVLTGYANKKNVKKAYESGADKVLPKPLDMEKLLEEINLVI